MAFARSPYNVGVDVFFAISGYLISAVIPSDIVNSEFSIAGFYDRRIRRILPALLAMMIVTTAFAWRCFIPSELVAFARSQVAALFSVSNILFWKQTGYFESLTGREPGCGNRSRAIPAMPA